MSESFFSLKGKTALITGAGRGIGASIARRFAKAGASVVINYLNNEEESQAVLNEIKADSPNSSMKQFDIADPAQSTKSVDEILGQYENIDILVCNAGISRDALILRATPEQFEETLRINLMGAMNMIAQISRPMMKNRWGRIICMSSVIGEMGNKGQSAYAASKAGLLGFVKSVAKELGSRGVTCNAIAPGFIETEMTAQLPDEVRKAYQDAIPVGRMAKPEEVAYAAHFLASEEAAYLTGLTLDVNGGLLMR